MCNETMSHARLGSIKVYIILHFDFQKSDSGKYIDSVMLVLCINMYMKMIVHVNYSINISLLYI